jgi:Fic-DOC domain mobile mystery protein B
VTGVADEPDDATPLSAEERDGLIPSHVTLRRELNELEQQNILTADIWAFQRSRDPLREPFGRNLHRRMFGDVWRWAGTYRTSNKNIGVDRERIQLSLHETFGNARYWIEQTTYPPDEIAIRFHHALVVVHPFPNGNGRWSRLMADILAARLEQRRFTWGRSILRADDETRRIYIAALRSADRRFEFGDLVSFARS